ncbi:methyltransferase domain-containing protein [Candidatus Woesearchaeota archaeon]|nr:methyltransferase domain-containing protein [Candidatus Woesearchaeota archaeon]HIJ02673.1 methyltransferase domain-containing protein [Candidatus Woesearchaeota archaeon]HIJ14426.1 methyltransferase domain-containing protein [Candidatus Woesearchaeota archaeon]
MKLYKNKAYLYDKFIEKTGRDYSQLAQFLKKYIKKTDKMLYLGAGTGTGGAELQKQGFHILCSDINLEMLNIAKSKGMKCIKLDMKKFRLKEKVDVILSLFNTIMYNNSNQDLRNNIQSCYDNLKQKGRLIIEMTNPELLLSKGKDYTQLWEIDDENWIVQSDKFNNDLLIHRFIFINLKTKKIDKDIQITRIFPSKTIIQILREVNFISIKAVNKGNTLFIIANKA